MNFFFSAGVEEEEEGKLLLELQLSICVHGRIPDGETQSKHGKLCFIFFKSLFNAFG